jgi:D-threo-aldose 1-dehydrogenase
MTNREEVRHNIASFEADIPDQVWSDLLGEGLLDERAPIRA